MKSDLKNKAIQLRLEKQLPYGEIKRRLGVSKATLSNWLSQLPLSEERMLELRRAGWKNGELSREKYRETMRKKSFDLDKQVFKKYKSFLNNISSREKFIAGLVLYLAEGAKYNKYQVVLTNTDPRPLKFFISWLREFFGVNKERLYAQLHLYENMDIAREQTYWEKKLGFKDFQFNRNQIRKLRFGSFTYKNSVRHGTCQVRFGDVKVKREITQAINVLFEEMC